MAFDGGGGVAQGLGDDGHGCEFGEFVQGAEAGGAGAEEIAELVSEAGGVDVAAGGVAAKDPVAVGVCCGEVVGGGGMELSERFVEGLR